MYDALMRLSSLVLCYTAIDCLQLRRMHNEELTLIRPALLNPPC